MMAAQLGLGLLCGAVASWLYFAGLWWTVQRIADVRRPQLVLVGSFVARAVLLLWVVAGLATWSVAALLGAAVGFWAMRRRVVGRHVEVMV